MVVRDLAALKPYEIIYTDPPWQLQKTIRRTRPNQGRDLDYPTMSMEDIFALHEKFFEAAAPNHNVFMWCIEKYLHEAEDEMAKRGYKLHCRFVWDKGNGVCPAFTVRFSHEYLLWFFKPGHIIRPDKPVRGRFGTVIREAHTYHSHKPVAAYEMIETMFPAQSKIELFARAARGGGTALEMRFENGEIHGLYWARSREKSNRS